MRTPTKCCWMLQHVQLEHVGGCLWCEGQQPEDPGPVGPPLQRPSPLARLSILLEGQVVSLCCVQLRRHLLEHCKDLHTAAPSAAAAGCFICAELCELPNRAAQTVLARNPLAAGET